MEKSKRLKKGIRTGVWGTLANIAIASGKLAAGILGHSTAITADAIHNYSDAFVSLATTIGLKYSAKGPDEKHPYGHGRLEYIVAFIVAMIIIVASLEFFKVSLKQIIKSVPITYNTLAFVIVTLSASGKGLLFLYYKVKNKSARSPVIKAAALDSLGDTIIGLSVAAAYFFSRYTVFPLDGVCGILISLIIAYSGIALIKETMADIIGGAHNKEVCDKIKELIAEYEIVQGTHDLMLHSYGLDKHIASIHIEVPCKLTFAQAHKIADEIERRSLEELQVELVVHIDPANPYSKTVSAFAERIQAALAEINKELSFHDLDWDCKEKVLKFDLVVPYSLQAEQERISNTIESAFEKDIKLVYKIDFR